VVVEDSAQPTAKVRGVKVDLSSGHDHDQIYLDEEAAARNPVGTGGDRQRCGSAWDSGPQHLHGSERVLGSARHQWKLPGLASVTM
jgi:hypothetical protein